MKIDIAKVGLVAGAVGLFYWLFSESEKAAPAAATATATPTTLKGLAGPTRTGKKKTKKRKK